jgi:hypothetical protein
MVVQHQPDLVVLRIVWRQLLFPACRSATIIFPVRVASINDVTELLIVVGGRLQELSDVVRPQLVGLDAVR